MKGISVSKHTIFLVCISATSFCALFFVCHKLFASQTLSYSFDAAVSRDAQRDVKSFVSDLDTKSGITPAQIIEELHQNFKWIDSVAVRRLPRNVAHITIQAHKPLCALNTDYIMSDNGAIVQKNVYSKKMVAQLNTLYVPAHAMQDLHLSTVLRSYLASVPQSLFEQYEVHCVDDKKVMLRDRKDTYFTVMCNPQDTFDPSLMARCQKIKNSLAQRASGKKSKNWVADLRFSNQIILSDYSGGVSHGKNAC